MECEGCPKIPPGSPKTRFAAVELDYRGWMAYEHWKECEAVRDFPEYDEAVRKVASICKEAEKECNMVVEGRQQWNGVQAIVTAAVVNAGIKHRGR